MTVGRRSALRETAHRILFDQTGAVMVSRLCPRCGSAGHGQPSVRVASGPPPAVSLSYAGDLVAVAWCWTGAVGIDVEEVGPPVDGVDRRAWTRQEALFKAGQGEHALTEIDVSERYLGTVAGASVTWLVAGPAVSSA